MNTSLNLYAEHEFNASTFTARVIAGTGSDMYSCIVGAIGALRGPKHGGANEVSFEILSRYADPDEAEADIRKRVAAKETPNQYRDAIKNAIFTAPDLWPPEAAKKITGKRTAIACSIMRVSFSPTTDPILPPRKEKSKTPNATSRS